MIKLNVENTKQFFKMDDYDNYSKKVLESFDILLNKNGLGNDFLGWLDLPNNFDTKEIKEVVNEIRSKCKILVVIGIGGSYLGAAAVINACKKYFNNEYEVIFAGMNLSSEYLVDLIEYLSDKDFCINVISKSGTTTEPAIAFRILKNLLEKKYGKNHNRIYVTTDKAKGSLKQLAVKEGYKTFDIPDDVGGRFSVLSNVGVLPIAFSGVNIDELLEGAKSQRLKCMNKNIDENDSLKYALIRNVLHLDKDIEILVNYEPKLNLLAEWFKQLFGESEGKNNKGIYVSSASFSTDLHSLGQMIQDGKRNLFETIIKINKSNKSISIPSDNEDLDGLNYLSGKSLEFINENAMTGTLIAHVDGNVPNIIIEVDELNAFTIGELIYFFEFSCGISGYVLGVNPFDQPGVEAYKRNMFALLGISGFEDLKNELERKIK